MNSQNQHTMVLSQEFPDGSQEWHCPTCGRRFIMQWPPNYKRTILDEGDTEATHAGGMGGVSMGGSEVQPGELYPAAESLPEEEMIPVEDHYLEPFKIWVDQQDW